MGREGSRARGQNQAAAAGGDTTPRWPAGTAARPIPVTLSDRVPPRRAATGRRTASPLPAWPCIIAGMVTVLIVLLAVAMGGVLLVLLVGVGAMARGGDFNRRNANKLMRWRVVLQLVAVVLFLLLVLALQKS